MHSVTIYLLCLQYSVKDRVFEVLVYFVHHEDEAVREMALSGLGKICIMLTHI